MKTYTTKIAKNGATLYYSVETGKRIAKNIALENEENYIIANGTIAERYDLANKYYRVNLNGEIEKDGHYTTIGYGKNGAYYTGANGWHVISNNCALIDLKRDYNITLDEFIVEYTKRHAAEVSEETAEINAADVKVNVADNGKIIEQIKVSVDTAIKIINRLNYRNDSFIYRFTTRDDNADIQYRHFNAYRDNGESDAFALTEIVINGKLEIVRFANLYRDIIVHLQIGNVNYTIGDKGAIVLTADKIVTFYPNATPKPCTGKLFGYDVCEYHSVEEYISELELTQIAVIMENLFKNEDGSFSYDGWGRKTYYMTDCYREAYYGGGYYNEITLDAESTTQLIYAEQQLKNIVNGSDGSEEDIDGDNVFDYLPALDELNDVDINDDDNTPPDNEPMSDDIDDICNLTPEWRIYRTEDDNIVETLTVNGEELTFINGAPNNIHSDTYKAGFSYFSCKFYSTDKKYKTIHEEEEFFAIMADRGACTIDDDDNTPPDSEAMSDDISDICKRTSEVDPAEYAINAEEYAREIPQHNPCSQIKQFFIGDTENHRAEIVTFEGDRWEIIKSNYYGAEMYNGTDNKIHFIVGEFYDDTTGKYFPEPERGMNTTDADEFFSIMQERGACTIDNDLTEAEEIVG